MDKRQMGAIAAVVLAVWGAIEFFGLERTWNTQFHDPYVIGAQETRFAGVRDVMPPDAISGYITDLEPNTIGWSAAFNGAQYVVAPRILEPGTDRAWLLTNFSKPGVADVPAFARVNGYRIERDFGQGVYVLRKEAR
jgi:hypothetical protein